MNCLLASFGSSNYQLLIVFLAAFCFVSDACVGYYVCGLLFTPTVRVEWMRTNSSVEAAHWQQLSIRWLCIDGHSMWPRHDDNDPTNLFGIKESVPDSGTARGQAAQVHN
jgi:hypothetical protein